MSGNEDQEDSIREPIPVSCNPPRQNPYNWLNGLREPSERSSEVEAGNLRLAGGRDGVFPSKFSVKEESTSGEGQSSF